MKKVSSERNVRFLDATSHFPIGDRRLWSWKDGVHISEDRGIPLLRSLLALELEEAIKEKSEEAVLYRHAEEAARQLAKSERDNVDKVNVKKQEKKQRDAEGPRSRRSPGWLCE